MAMTNLRLHAFECMYNLATMCIPYGPSLTLTLRISDQYHSPMRA